MAIKDVLPLKAARRAAIATVKICGASDTRDLISMVTFTLTMRRHLIWLAWAPFTSSRLATFAWVPFAACNTWQRSTMQNLRRVGETPVLFQAICGPKFTKFSDDVGSSYSTFQRRFPIVCFTFCWEDICHQVWRSSKTRTNVKVFMAPNFLGGTTPTFLRQFVSAIYCPPPGKVWLSSVCWSPSAKPGNEAEWYSHCCAEFTEGG